MLKNKRTRVLLAILGGVLVIGIGAVIWGAATGKIKSFADTWPIMGPPKAPTLFTVNGTVKDDSGKPLPHIYVSLLRYDSSTNKYDSRGGKYTSTSFLSPGTYDFGQVAPTGFTYKVSAVEQPGCHNPDTSGNFTSNANTTVTENLVMPNYPWIQGKVTMPDGTPANGAAVWVAIKTGNNTYTDSGGSKTDKNGQYKMLCLIPNGDYVIGATLEIGNNDYIDNNVSAPEFIASTAGKTINFILKKESGTGRITPPPPPGR